jgi:hypothetical protein
MCCFIIDIKTGMLIIAIITILIGIGGLIDAVNSFLWVGGGRHPDDQSPLFGIISLVFLIPQSIAALHFGQWVQK